MRSRNLVRATALAVALGMIAATAAVAAVPRPGLLYRISSANADLIQEGDCEGGGLASANISFTFNLGTNIEQTGTEHGPTVWRDIDFGLWLYSCEGAEFAFGGGSRDLAPYVDASRMRIDPLTSASLEDVSFLAYPEGSDAVSDLRLTFDLTWQATGKPVTEAGRDNAPFLVTRAAPAEVSGTVVVSGLGSEWGDAVTFDVDGVSDGTSLAIGNWVALP